MGLFDGLQIALDLGFTVSFKKKSELRKKITENGGTISYIVTKKCHMVVTSDPEKCDVSSKCRMALKHGLPVLKLDYIWDCLEAEKLLSKDSYVVGGKSKTLDFKSGKISALVPKEKSKKFRSKTVFNPRAVRAYTSGDPNQPGFDEDGHEVAKYAIFSGYSSTMKCDWTSILELHTPPALSTLPTQDDSQLPYRVLLHSGSSKELEEGRPCHKDYRYVQTAEQALAVYAMLHGDLDKKSDMEKVTSPVRGIGSLKLQKLMAEMASTHEGCTEEVQELVEHIWAEATAEITSVLGDISSIKLEQVEKAEAILVKVSNAVKSGNSEKIIQDLICEFYSTLMHKNENASSVTLKDRKKWLVTKQDMCQLVKDMISVSEMTNFETRAFVEAKYAALRCRISHLNGNKMKEVENRVTGSLEGPDSNLTILNVFEVWRQVEDVNFRHDLEPKDLLFHSSKVENFVGILSRGLLLPKVVVDDFGGKRSDAGMLGSGIYFASAASTSVKYSSPSKTKGSRFLLVNEVALGRTKNFSNYAMDLVAPPGGYDSTHGVSKKWDSSSQFENDEYVVYSTNQQRVRYLVEFALKEDKLSPVVINKEDTTLMQDADFTDTSDVSGITDPLSKVKPGLVGTGDKEVELRGVHIRAKLVDLAAQVVVLQEYHNNSAQPIEAKYVFPLDDAAAVCGFEAFINGKHIVGEVKEKETAHKEYKKAIREGHGAYLMDQDEETPDVFTVSVGNLPAGAFVLIKITYVADLQVEDEQISFHLPATVAPWKEDSALKLSTQEELESHKMAAARTSVQVAVEMPFDIRTLVCPTHKVKIKQTASKAYVEMSRHQSFGSGFQLLIGLAEIHVPRMWVERHPDNEHHQACMLTFYPEFESAEVTEGEVIIFLDTSNSMKGTSMTEAKKVALLVLQSLPESWHFNVVRFGSDYEEVFTAPRPSRVENINEARQFIQNSVANKGNTDAMQPLRSLFLLPRSDTQRNVFLISDGHINNEETLLRQATLNSSCTRVFSFGVSSTCNSYFLKALARVSGGAFEFFNVKTKSKWEPKVKNQLNKASQPGLTSVSVEWRQYDDNLPPPVQAPRQITALFNGSRQVIYGFVPNCTMATLTAVVAGQEVSTVVSTSELSITEGQLVHRLTARAVIRDWEDGVLSGDRTRHEMAKLDLKSYIIDLSKEYSIVTQFTSFIAVEKREENEKETLAKGPSIEELLEKENVDILHYMDFTKIPEEDILTLIADLSLEVQQKQLSNKMADCLEDVGRKYEELRVKMGPCDVDVLNAAKVLSDVYCLQGDKERGIQIAQNAESEARLELDNISDGVKKNEVMNILSALERQQEYEISVRTLTGKSLPIMCKKTMTVKQLKSQILEKEGMPPDSQRIIFKGLQLEDDEVLGDIGMASNSLVHLVCRLRGGEDFPCRTGSGLMSDMEEQEPIYYVSNRSVMRGRQQEKSRSRSRERKSRFSLFSSTSDESDESESSEDEEEEEEKDVAEMSVDLLAAAEPVVVYFTTLGEADKASVKEMDPSYDRKKKVEKPIEQYFDDESDGDEEMGFCLFDGDEESAPSLMNEAPDFLSGTASLAKPEEGRVEKLTEEYFDEESDGDEEMGFGLFDDDAKPLSNVSFDGVKGPTSWPKKQHGFLAKEKGKAEMFLKTDEKVAPVKNVRLQKLARKSAPSSLKDLEEKESTVKILSAENKEQSFITEHLGVSRSKKPQKSCQYPQLAKQALKSTATFISVDKKQPRNLPSMDSAQLVKGTGNVSFGTVSNFASTMPAPQQLKFGSLSAPPPPAPPIPRTSFGVAAPLIPATGGGSFGAAAMPVSQGFSFGSLSGPPPPPQPSPGTSFGVAAPLIPATGGGSFGAAAMPVSQGFGFGSLSGPQPPPQRSLGTSFGGSASLIPATDCRSFESSPGFSVGNSAPPPPIPSCGFLPQAQAYMSPASGQMPGYSDTLSMSQPTALPDMLKSSLMQRSTSKKKIAPEEISYSLSSSLLSDNDEDYEKELQSVLELPVPEKKMSSPAYRPTSSTMLASFEEIRESDKTSRMEEKKKKKKKMVKNYVSWRAMPEPERAMLDDEDDEDDNFNGGKGGGKGNRGATRGRGGRGGGGGRYCSIGINRLSDEARPLSRDRACPIIEDEASPMIPKRPQHLSRKRQVEEDEFSKTLSSFGIGSGITCIRKRGGRLKEEELEKLLQCQKKDGCWDFGSDLDRNLGIDSDKCLNILKSSGLSSLGKTASQQVRQHLATLIVLFALGELLMPEIFPLNFDLLTKMFQQQESFYQKVELRMQNEHFKDVSAIQLMKALEKAFNFLREMDKKYPVVYSTLELGPSWYRVVEALMQPAGI